MDKRKHHQEYMVDPHKSKSLLYQDVEPHSARGKPEHRVPKTYELYGSFPDPTLMSPATTRAETLEQSLGLKLRPKAESKLVVAIDVIWNLGPVLIALIICAFAIMAFVLQGTSFNDPSKGLKYRQEIHWDKNQAPNTHYDTNALLLLKDTLNVPFAKTPVGLALTKLDVDLEKQQARASLLQFSR